MVFGRACAIARLYNPLIATCMRSLQEKKQKRRKKQGRRVEARPLAGGGGSPGLSEPDGGSAALLPYLDVTRELKKWLKTPKKKWGATRLTFEKSGGLLA